MYTADKSQGALWAAQLALFSHHIHGPPRETIIGIGTGKPSTTNVP